LRNIGRIFRFPDGSRSFENAVAQSLLNKVTMKTRSSHISIFLVCFLLAMAGSAWGQLTTTDQARALFDRINEARQAPVAAAASVGIGEPQLFDIAPELQSLPDGGMLPLAMNGHLLRTAGGHNEDMLARGYVDRVTPEGLTVAERVAASGYWAVAAGESIGLVGFANFLPPEVAVQVMFENMLRDELLNRAEGRWNILNPGFAEVGVAVETGVMAFGGAFFNVYIAVCDYGRPYEVTADEELFLVLVNQARSNPAAFMASIGLSEDRLAADLKENLVAFFAGMPPLFPDFALSRAARGHAEDMLAQGYFSAESLDGRTPADRIAEAGYRDALESGETQGLLALCGDRTPAEQVEAFFRRVAASELTWTLPEERLIFNPRIREAGIGFAQGICEPLGGICGDNVGLLVADYGMSPAYNSGVVGVAFRDENGNALYDRGEGLGGVGLRISGVAIGSLDVTAGQAGGFQAVLDEGVYEILPAGAGPEEAVPLAVPAPGESVFILLSIPGPPEAEVMEDGVQKGLDN